MQQRFHGSEVHRRLMKLEREGGICLQDARKDEIVLVYTEVTVYKFEVTAPTASIVTVTSPHDPDFFDGRLCRFLGSIWDNIPIVKWTNAPFRMPGYLHKDCYPVVELQGHLVVLPKIFEVYLGGRPFFKA